MAITFAYTESTNKVVLTEGTSGTPATFADFVTADRAGTGTDLLPAENCTTNHTLTYAVRPVEDLAIQINFILSGTSAGGGDTLDVTGTLFDGSAQTDNIDVSGGDATYNGSYKWASISDIDCTGWADGTLQVTQDVWGVIWDYGNGQYRVDSHFDIGNGGTTTYFQSSREMVFFAEHINCRTKAVATTTIGSLANGEVETGSYWSLDTNLWAFLLDGGTLYLYGTTIYTRTSGAWLDFRTGDLTIERSILDMEGRLYFLTGLSSANFDNLYISQGLTISLRIGPDTMSNVAFNNLTDYLTVEEADATATGLKMLNPSTFAIAITAPRTLNDIDPGWAVDMAKIAVHSGAGTTYKQIYTCNIHVADKNGANLSGVTVDCENTSGTAVWTAGSITTDANGDIAEQQIEYRRKEYVATVTTYSPHKFTISLPGYETLVLDAITVDAPIVWHLELQPLRARIYGRSHRIQASQFQ